MRSFVRRAKDDPLDAASVNSSSVNEQKTKIVTLSRLLIDLGKIAIICRKLPESMINKGAIHEVHIQEY